MYKEAVVPFLNHVNRLLSEKETGNNSPVTNAEKSPIEIIKDLKELKELKELVDIGAITEEEFQVKKDELMKKI